jgi:hypothetical protein
VMEQMAGIAFRIQNETNFYVLRASSLGNTFRFYKVVNGERGNIIGPEIPIPVGTWHELGVECKGNQIHCSLDGKEVIPTLVDPSFTTGKIGFWTKSDSVSYFVDTRIVYTLREAPVQGLVRSVLKEYPKLLGLQVFVAGADPGTVRMVASKQEKEVGQPGGKAEQSVLSEGLTFVGKDKEKSSMSVTLPLRDRNGDIIAAVRVVMKSFVGQTEANAVVRAKPVVQDLQANVQSLSDLVD